MSECRCEFCLLLAQGWTLIAPDGEVWRTPGLAVHQAHVAKYRASADRGPCGCAKGVTPHGVGWRDCVLNNSIRERAEAVLATGNAVVPVAGLLARDVLTLLDALGEKE